MNPSVASVRPRIAVSMGDPAGIGPEIVRAALADPAIAALADFTCLGDQPWPGPMGRPSAQGGWISLAAVESAIELAKGGKADAVVTAPISKESWSEAGAAWPGHTELLAERFASPRSAMLFVGPSLRVVLCTIHVALRDVPGLLTTPRVRQCIDLAHEACVSLGVPAPRIGVAGLNPHAGEGGLFGDEDASTITPAVNEARAAGVLASGPWPGDVVFLRAVKGDFDAVVAMYHDQGLIPVKLLDRDEAVNVTAGLTWRGLPVIRTSPAHGTAFDIAGQGRANPASMKAAIRLAVQMTMARKTRPPAP